MMAIIGTSPFNFQVVFPLLVTRTFGGTEAAYTVLFSVISHRLARAERSLSARRPDDRRAGRRRRGGNVRGSR